MGKEHEIDYLRAVSRERNVPLDEFRAYLSKKPYSDDQSWRYLQEIGQLLRFLPPRPARLLDVGVGSGWTSEIFARCGYDVVGVDIAPDMIDLANRRLSPDLSLCFQVVDFERRLALGAFDAITAYDCLHHAENPEAVFAALFDCLVPGGVMLMIEPGKGHGATAESVAATQEFGVTEKDLPFSLVKKLLKRIGYVGIAQYPLASRLAMYPVNNLASLLRQPLSWLSSLFAVRAGGFTSMISARRP